MSDPAPAVPETEIDDQIDDQIETVIEHPADTDVTIEVETPVESESELSSETDTEEQPPPVEIEESAVTSSHISVAADSSPGEAVQEEVKKVERKPDTRPKRNLKWRAFILGGSGGTS